MKTKLYNLHKCIENSSGKASKLLEHNNIKVYTDRDLDPEVRYAKSKNYSHTIRKSLIKRQEKYLEI